MAYTYKFCINEKERDSLLDRMFKHHRIHWRGCFGSIENVTCERIDKFDNSNNLIMGTILYMEHPKGQFYNMNDIRQEINEDIRTGKYTACR